jgi:DNA-binding beta-propeller fold protein YncE
VNAKYYTAGKRPIFRRIVALVALAIFAALQSMAAAGTVPVVSITGPADHSSIEAACLDVLGTFSAKNLKDITVNCPAMGCKIPATIQGNTFEARDFVLAPGTNVIMVVAEDLAGNIGSNSIGIVGPHEMPTNGLDAMPVKLTPAPLGGFSPLRVNFTVQAHVPGKILRVIYDFDGDGVPDLTNLDLRPVTYNYETNRQYFPVVTIQTDVAQFSSSGPLLFSLAMFFGVPGAIASVNVQEPPVVMFTIPIADPVDLKWTAASNLYVLSGNIASITEFDGRGKIIRSLKGIGSGPSGLDVDGGGNVYVAVTGDKLVKKFKPTANSFKPDASFGNNGAVGAGQFNAPFDVKLSPGGQSILVSDSGSGQLQPFSLDGVPQSADDPSFGSLKAPTGLAHDVLGGFWFVVDSGNGRVALRNPGIDYNSGTNGAALGEFNGAQHLSANNRGLYVADTGNNRVQVFGPVEQREGTTMVPFFPRVALSGELGLKDPKSVAAVDDLLEEKFYIADTGNNRVLLVKLPSDTPEKVWKHMIARLKAGDIPGAISDFSIDSKENYRKTYESLSKQELLSTIKDIENITVSDIDSDTAEYYFETPVQGKTLLFPVKFDKEFGQWKISEY